MSQAIGKTGITLKDLNVSSLTVIGHIVDIIVGARLKQLQEQVQLLLRDSFDYLDERLPSATALQAFTQKVERFMADATTALSDLTNAVNGVGQAITDAGTRVSTDLTTLRAEIQTLESTGDPTTVNSLITGIEAAVSQMTQMSSTLAAIDPAAPLPPPTPPAPPITPTNPVPTPPADPTFARDPVNNKPLYTFTGTNTPNPDIWAPASVVGTSNLALYTFVQDTSGGAPTGVSAVWVLYNGPTTPPVPPASPTPSPTPSASARAAGTTAPPRPPWQG